MKTFKCPRVCGLFIVLALFVSSCPVYGQETSEKLYNMYYAIASNEQYTTLFGEGLPASVEQVTFGWSRIDVSEDGTAKVATEMGEGSFYIPTGAEELLEQVKNEGVQRVLNVYGDGRWDEVLPQSQHIADQLLALVKGKAIPGIAFDAVVLDFESVPARLKNDYLIAVWKIATPLQEAGVDVQVAAQPRQAYDLKILTSFVDGVILMLHDYEPKSLPARSSAVATMRPQTPIGAIEGYLKSNVAPLSEEAVGKLMFQLSFASTQWKLKGKYVGDGTDEKVYPYRPTYDMIQQRMDKIESVHFKYDEEAQNPYLLYYTEEDGCWNVLWYEDERSVTAKMDLAGSFGITRFSVWRLGNIPNAPVYKLGIPKLLEWEIDKE